MKQEFKYRRSYDAFIQKNYWLDLKLWNLSVVSTWLNFLRLFLLTFRSALLTFTYKKFSPRKFTLVMLTCSFLCILGFSVAMLRTKSQVADTEGVPSVDSLLCRPVGGYRPECSTDCSALRGSDECRLSFLILRS